VGFGLRIDDVLLLRSKTQTDAWLRVRYEVGHEIKARTVRVHLGSGVSRVRLGAEGAREETA